MCKSCPPGKFNSGTSRTSLSECAGCDAGSYQPPDVNGQQQPCAKCQAGTFTDTSGQSTCSACAVGKYAAADGQTVCDTCAIGKSNPLTGQTSPGVSSLAIALSLPDAMHVRMDGATRHDRIAMGRCVCGLHQGEGFWDHRTRDMRRMWSGEIHCIHRSQCVLSVPSG